MASAEVEAVFDAFDKETGDGRDYDLTVELAHEFVEAHPDSFVLGTLEDLSLEECVKSLEVLRDAGWEEPWKQVQIYLWHKFPPQNIGGAFGREVQV